jgi:hypothetical protein
MSFPKLPFKLSVGNDPRVRQWLHNNGVKWYNNNRNSVLLSSIGNHELEKYICVDINKKLTWTSGPLDYAEVTDMFEINPYDYMEQPVEQQHQSPKLNDICMFWGDSTEIANARIGFYGGTDNGYFQRKSAINDPSTSNWKHCLPFPEWENEVTKPKDKDLVYAWDDNTTHARDTLFFDAKNNCAYQGTSERNGYDYDHYEVIPREQWPQWAIEAYKTLEN